MRILIWLLTILILTSAAASVATAMERTPPGSYLQFRATTINELRQQIATDKLVQSRYSRHFGVSPQQLDKFIAGNLQLVALKSPLLVETYYINRFEQITTRKKLLPTGTMVFATNTGEPVLAWSCGNPLRPDLPPDVKVKANTDEITDTKHKVLAAPVETITNAVITAPPAPAVVSVVPVEAASALSFVSAPAVSMPPLIAGLGGLGALGALGGLVGFAKGPTYSTPEPSSIMAMGMWFSLIPTIYRLKRRKAQKD